MKELIYFTERDLALKERLQPFLSERIFDAHAHLHRARDLPEGNLFRLLGTADAGRLAADARRIYGDRKFGALLLPMPSVLFRGNTALRDEVNAWMAAQLEAAPGCVGAAYVMPGDSEEKIEAMLTSPRFRGLKCYHQTAEVEGPTFDANIGRYLPEAAWRVADRRGLAITLHMVKDRSLADPENLAYIRTMTARYPNARLILAHCARGFASWTAIEALRSLAGIPNIYYDMAAVSDPAVMFETIRQGGADHVLWGTDYLISMVHGKAISVGEGFTWLYPHALPEGIDLPVSLTVLESLFAFYQAALMLDLGRPELDGIFCRNAERLFGV